MSRRRKLSDSTPFDTIKLEGTLFVPELLERAASGEATAQKEADYAIPKGLKLHDEYGRAFRIATASWQAFAPQIARADLDAAAVTQSFVLDLLRQCLGYTDLAHLSSPIHPPSSSDRGFPITAQALGGRLPVIIAPHHLGLDDPDPRFAILGSGTRRKSAHQLAQEFLNASRDCLWAIVTNGKTLRLLRDADTLTRPNFLEFDLETILRDDQHRYADFSALWRILHASRAGAPLPPSPALATLDELPAARPASTDCIWEQWKTEGHAQGLRVRDGLRDGVQEAILILANGYLTHPDNDALRQRLHDGTLTLDAYFQQFFRLIYRCIFLFCTEERDLLHNPDSTAAARGAYAEGYSLRRLRNRSLRQTALDGHGDLWLSLRIVFKSLATGQPRLALPALGGLFADSQCPDLDSASLSNRDLLSAMRELRWFFDRKTGKRSAIDYRNMGTQELGSVYESLLELVPTLDLPARAFGFAGITDTGSTSGNARKTTGSYYTADPLVMELINSALEPVIRQRLADARDLAALPWSTVATRIKDDRVQCFYVLAYLVKHAAVPAGASPETLGRAWDALPAAARSNPLCAEALLSITVCDPSCGSGHFLLAAARRLAEKLAELRAPDGAVRPDDYRHALREVASRCLYGVDINPMAVELCRVALWLETVDPGKPLGFLNHHIRTGNSLLGTTPDLIAAGLPDDTFTAIEGDEKPACAELKKRNKKEREGFGPLFEKEEQSIRDRLRQAATQIEAMDDSQPAALQQKEAAFTTSETAPEYRHAKLLADLWCAAFVIKKTYPAAEGEAESAPSPISDLPSAIEGHLLHTDDDLFGQSTPTPEPKAASKKQQRTKNQEQGTASGITTAHLRDFVQGKPLPADLQTEVEALARQYRFFHWHLAFPQVFDQGGFACILGNPPWEMPEVDDREFFALHNASIANEESAKERARMIASLELGDPSLHEHWLACLRSQQGTRLVISSSGKYPNGGTGRLNLFRIFVELGWLLTSTTGRLGMVIPSGLTTNAYERALWTSLVQRSAVVSVFDFENKRGLFPNVHSSAKFTLLTLGFGDGSIQSACWLHDPSELVQTDRVITISANDLERWSPEELSLPQFRSSLDLVLLQYLMSGHQAFGDSPEWAHTPKLMFSSSDDAFAPLSSAQLQALNVSAGNRGADPAIRGISPVYEGKMVGIYDHRQADIIINAANRSRKAQERDIIDAEKRDPLRFAFPQYWLWTEAIRKRRFSSSQGDWELVFCDVSSATNERTCISCIVPLSGLTRSLPAIYMKSSSAVHAVLALSTLASMPFDYLARLKVSANHLTQGILESLAVPALADLIEFGTRMGSEKWISDRALELTYTAWDLEAFAADCGWSGPPFRWDEERRFLLRCELDAAFFHLYLGPQSEWQQQPEALTRAFPTPRHAVSYIMDTFPIVKRKDEAKHNHYRTQQTILQIYDALGEAMQTGVPYKSLLNPPPADQACSHPPRTTS